MWQSRQKKNLIGVLIVLLVCMFSIPCFGDTVKIGDLIAKPEAFDGKTVQVEGEVIGDVMIRADNAWVNISDTSGVMGIWLTKEDAKRIHVTGDYKHVGDVIAVEGVFHQSFTAQNGDTATQATKMMIIQEGSMVVRSISDEKAFWAIGLTILVVALNWGRLMLWMKQKLKWKSK
ncbi:MAG: hypothetical protein ACRCTE_11625, partial [Cellulosilyticaceae bacterium]